MWITDRYNTQFSVVCCDKYLEVVDLKKNKTIDY